MLYIWCTDGSNTIGYCSTAEKLPYSTLLHHSSCIYWLSIKPRLSWGQQCCSFVVIEIPEICFRVKYSLICIVLIQAGILNPQDNRRSKRLTYCRSIVAYLLTFSVRLYVHNACELISSCQMWNPTLLSHIIWQRQIYFLSYFTLSYFLTSKISRVHKYSVITLLFLGVLKCGCVWDHAFLKLIQNCKLKYMVLSYVHCSRICRLSVTDTKAGMVLHLSFMQPTCFLAKFEVLVPIIVKVVFWDGTLCTWCDNLIPGRACESTICLPVY
jgi:hypothetical protein